MLRKRLRMVKHKQTIYFCMFVVLKQNRYYNIIVFFQIQAISMNTNRTLKELCLLGGLTYSAFGMAQERPNIIVFLVDDMGLMDTSVPFITDAQGKPVKQPLNEWYHTPNMERLASQGICFSTFYAQSVSSPSRASLMTGQNATRHGVTNWINAETNNRETYGPPAWNWEGLKEDMPTLPKVLQQSGYKTIHVGKAHFGCKNSEGEDPKRLGFDVNIAGSGIGEPGSYYGEWGYGHIKGNKRRAVPGLEKYHGTQTFLTEALTLEANNEITKASQENRPFYLYMSHYAVHTPFQVDKRFASRYQNAGRSAKEIAFATLVEGMDKSLGDIMDHLNELGIAENTLILFLGDNGSGAPVGEPRGYGSSAPLKGMKGTEFEGGTRVPFIAGWAKPDKNNKIQKGLPIECGATQTQMGTIMDIYPTVLSAAGCEVPRGHVIDGYNLKKQLTGKVNKKRPETFLMHFPHAHRGNYFTVCRQGDWKLVYYYNPETPDKPGALLYNLKEDPEERNELASKYPGKCKEMILAMCKQMKKEGALYPIDKNGKELKPYVFF